MDTSTSHHLPPIVVHAIPVQFHHHPPPQADSILYEVYDDDASEEQYFGGVSCLFTSLLFIFCCPFFWIPVVCPMDTRRREGVLVVARQNHEATAAVVRMREV